jgi:hypothetical protein
MLSGTRLVDAASIYPDILQSITGSLFCARLCLAIAILALASAFHKLFESHFIPIIAPGMREYSDTRRLLIEIGFKAQVCLIAAVYKTHCSNLEQCDPSEAKDDRLLRSRSIYLRNPLS